MTKEATPLNDKAYQNNYAIPLNGEAYQNNHAITGDL